MRFDDDDDDADREEDDDDSEDDMEDEYGVDEDDEDDEFPQEDDEQLEDLLDNDLTWELEIARRKKRWRLKENELRSAKAKFAEKGINEEERALHHLYHDPNIKNRQPKQVSRNL